MYSEAAPLSQPGVRMASSPKLLLGIYLIIPATMLFLTTDWLASGLHFSRSLPSDPHQIQWFNMFFMLPHILASLFTFVDKDYLRSYRSKLSVFLPLAAMWACSFCLGRWV